MSGGVWFYFWDENAWHPKPPPVIAPPAAGPTPLALAGARGARLPFHTRRDFLGTPMGKKWP